MVSGWNKLFQSLCKRYINVNSFLQTAKKSYDFHCLHGIVGYYVGLID